MLLRQIYDPYLAQYTYLVGCPASGDALLVDPQRDVDRYLELITREGLRLTAVTETHIHADYLSGVRELAHRFPDLTVYLSAEGGADWQYRWPELDGRRVVRVLDGDVFRVGGVEVRALHTPGHTPEHLSFLLTDRGAGAGEPIGALTGDFVFVGDLGRPDLLESAAGQVGSMEPAARRLRESAQAFLRLPDHLQVWPGHGAGSACGKALGAVPSTTVGYERRMNLALREAEGPAEAFVAAILSDQPEPPVYFARMKRDNRDGAALLGGLPAVPTLAAHQAAALAERLQVVDTRPDWAAFAAGHLPGSLWAPVDNQLATVLGSFVDPTLPVLLVVEPEQAEEVVRVLVRLGVDQITGQLAPAALSELSGLATVTEASAGELRAALAAGAVPLDLRRAAEVRASGRLPGALHVPHTRLAARLAELPRGPELLLYCASGRRASLALPYLRRQGFRARVLRAPFATLARAATSARPAQVAAVGS